MCNKQTSKSTDWGCVFLQVWIQSSLSLNSINTLSQDGWQMIEEKSMFYSQKLKSYFWALFSLADDQSRWNSWYFFLTRRSSSAFHSTVRMWGSLKRQRCVQCLFFRLLHLICAVAPSGLGSKLIFFNLATGLCCLYLSLSYCLSTTHLHTFVFEYSCGPSLTS